jgi:hypothetical protein
VNAEGLRNVALVKDDLFASDLEPSSFDLVHARFEIAPLGRGKEQLATYLRLVRPGGTIVLEDPDFGSLRFNPPPTPAQEELITLIKEAFRRSGGDLNAGRTHLELFRGFGIEANVGAEVLALPPGHPYLRLPLQFSTALTPRLRSFVNTDKLERLHREAEAELREPGRWGTTFTLLQAWGQRVA